jgi:hypothetical protein
MKEAKRAKKSLDTISPKRGRGRPGVRASEISGRAGHYRLIFEQTWEVLGNDLISAKTEKDVIRVFEQRPTYQQEFQPIASLIIRVLRDPKFPKRPEPQRNFLADSLAGRGWISPRRSRDICLQERNKKEDHIIRREYYVECTCGYKGPALDGGCRRCGVGKFSHPIFRFDWQ